MVDSCSSSKCDIAGGQLSSEPEVPDSVPEAEKESAFSASCIIMLTEGTVLCWNMLLGYMFYIMPKIVLT